MYLAKEKSKSVKGDSYEGHIETEGEHQLVAPGFSGQKFSAILDTNHGRTRLEFLVAEHINPNLN